jgi:UDP-N-acetylmuramoyl-tripeptide--D-alanyl-D-alanine ligase
MSVSSLKQAEELITLTAQEICEACDGELLCGLEAAAVESVSTDTRADLEGGLFVALRGEHFDGGDFAAEALAQGAMGVMAEADAAQRLAAGFAAGEQAAPVIIAVADSGQALKRVASLVASRSQAPVIAITGSTGKTSTKDILFSLLASQRNVVASRASFNNEVGVPLTLLSITGETEVAVVEMGMQAPGEIGELCQIAAPQIAVITNIGPAHLEYAGSLENIARGKAEIAQGLPESGGLVAPYGEELLTPYLTSLKTRVVTFGFDPAADVHTAGHERLEDGRLCCTLSCMGEEIDICFNFAARHHLLNAMAAIAAYRILGLPLAPVAEAARDLHLPALRGELIALSGGGTLLNDCYNANPLSMRSSLEYLVNVGAGRRTVAVLGDMGELGPDSPRWHREVGGEVSRLGIDCLIAVGDLAAGYLEGAREAGNGREYHHFAGRDEALARIPELIQPGDVVLVKASRFMKLEQLSEELMASGAESAGAGTEGGAEGSGGDTDPRAESR